MVDLGERDDETVARDQRRRAADGPVTWKISEYSRMPGYFPGAVGRKTCVRIGPLGVGKSANS